MEQKTLKQRYFTVVNSMGAVQRNAKSTFGNSKYASLSNIQKHLMPLLAEQNCYLHFDFGTFEGDVYNVKLTLLAWDTEEQMQWTFAVPLDNKQGNRVQAFGSTTTYAQRYALCVAFQIALDDEDPDAKSEPPKAQMKASVDSSAVRATTAQKPYLKQGDANWKKAVEYIVQNGKDGWAYTMSKFNITEEEMQKLESDVLFFAKNTKN